MNAGVLFIHAKKFNQLKLFDKIIKFYNKYAEEIKYVNQSGYSYLFEKYSNLCYIKISDIENVKPLNEDIDDKHFNKVRIFHCNGAKKNSFYDTYHKIMGYKNEL